MATAARESTPVPGTPKHAVVEKPRFPLVLKLFGATALLILMVVGVAAGITIERALRVASQTVNSSIANAAKLFRDFEKQRLDRLSISAEALGHDPTFVAYMQDQLNPRAESQPATPNQNAPAAAAAPPAIDFVSIYDQLLERKSSLDSDLVMLLDDQGRLVSRTDQPALSGTANMEDLYESMPLVRKIVDDANLSSTSGIVATRGKLYHAAIAPLGVGANNVRVAYLVNAYAIDDAFANRIGESTNAGVMFAPSPKAAPSAQISRSSNAPSVSMQQMTSLEKVFNTGKRLPPSNIKIDGSSYVMTAEPLIGEGAPVGAAVFLRSLDRELTPFKQINNGLMIGGGVALLLAFVLSWFISKRMTRPIETLARTAQAVTAGDYSVQPPTEGSDEVAILGRSFAQMMTALRDKEELEELYEQMAAKSAEREALRPPTEPAKRDEGTVLVTDLRGLPSSAEEGDAEKVIANIERVMKLQEGEITRQDGKVREVVGNRLVCVFSGDRGVIKAIRAARAMNEELGSLTDMNPRMTLGVGIATGDFVTGSLGLKTDTGKAIIGNAPLLAMLFASQAPNGVAYVSLETAQAAGNDVMSASQREEVQLKWIPQPLPVAALPLSLVTGTMMMRSMEAAGGDAATLRLDDKATAVRSAVPAGTIDLQPGQMFSGRYRIEQTLGRGGMGVVYRATDTQLDETVAIKTIPGDVMKKSAEDLERFKREIRLARKITHRNVLRTFDYGEADGLYFISMEYVRGYALNELLHEAPKKQLAMRAGLGIARQISRGLEVAHEQGIIHRDIKPQNVLIDAKGEVKLMDFGIARMAETSEVMTQAGLIVGTPHYMSPEQVQGNPLDARSDVYSLGVLMYEMFAGRKPFDSSSLTGVLTAHITEKPKPPIEIRKDVGREVNEIILKCLAKNAGDRYAQAGDLLKDLDQVQMAVAA